VNNDVAINKATHQRLVTRSLNQLMGIVNGVLCDGQLHDSEVHFLSTWLEENDQLKTVYPASVIYRLIREALADGVLTMEEKDHLLKSLSAISGNDFWKTGAALPETIASVFDDDPTVVFTGNIFVMTGEFMFGTRGACHRATEQRGGLAKDTVTNRTNFLVVGAMASPAWIESNFGRKIQKAAEMAESGDFEIAIIRESDWAMAL
jgi:NAD-dependent DNA ligase